LYAYPSLLCCNQSRFVKEFTLAATDFIISAPNEVTIAVEAIGLNYADIFAIKGLYSATPKGTFVPGLEYAGQVVQVGETVKHLRWEIRSWV
jgi:NADPH:quinone reductase-like Zn-dependent oxidoreductase